MQPSVQPDHMYCGMFELHQVHLTGIYADLSWYGEVQNMAQHTWGGCTPGISMLLSSSLSLSSCCTQSSPSELDTQLGYAQVLSRNVALLVEQLAGRTAYVGLERCKVCLQLQREGQWLTARCIAHGSAFSSCLGSLHI